jgi:hypothetical protein
MTNDRVKCRCEAPVVSSSSGAACCGICGRSLRNWRGKGGRYEPGPVPTATSAAMEERRIPSLNSPLGEWCVYAAEAEREIARLTSALRTISGQECTWSHDHLAVHALRGDQAEEVPRGLLTAFEADVAPGGWAEPLDTGGTVDLRTCEFCGCKTSARLRRCCNKGYEQDRAPERTA